MLFNLKDIVIDKDSNVTDKAILISPICSYRDILGIGINRKCYDTFRVLKVPKDAKIIKNY